MGSVDTARVDKTVKDVSAPVLRYASEVNYFVDSTLSEVNAHLDIIRGCECIRIARYNTQTVKATATIALAVELKIAQIWFHRSPQIMGIILVLYKFVNFTSRLINFIRTVAQVVRIVSTVNEILTALWPQYRTFINSIWKKVSQLSGAIGWGVDGFLHIMNAAQSGLDVWGAIRGKSGSVIEMEFGQKAIDTATSISFWLEGMTNDPGGVVRNLVAEQKIFDSYDNSNWWGNLLSGINEGLFRGEKALQHVEQTYSELSALRVNMPQLIAQYIPAGIWTALDEADSFIHDKIMPALNQVQSLVTTIQRATNVTNTQLSALAAKLASPGNLLQGVDSLPGFLKKDQETRIDDVTSREFEFWTDQERTIIEADLNAFDLIDSALKAPTPSPVYFELEGTDEYHPRGITVTPQETWMIGGYTSTY